MGAGSISVLNKTGVKIIVTLSKFGYQYCKRIEPGDTEKIECRRMKFTVTARLWDGKEPTWWDWVKPVLVAIAVTAASVSLGAAFLFSEKVVEGAAAGATATYLANVLREVPGVITAVLAFGAEVRCSTKTTKATSRLKRCSVKSTKITSRLKRCSTKTTKATSRLKRCSTKTTRHG
jgi:hypothetical protein